MRPTSQGFWVSNTCCRMVATTASWPMHRRAAMKSDNPIPNLKTVATPTSKRMKARPIPTLIHVRSSLASLVDEIPPGPPESCTTNPPSWKSSAKLFIAISVVSRLFLRVEWVFQLGFFVGSMGKTSHRRPRTEGIRNSVKAKKSIQITCHQLTLIPLMLG